MKTYTSKKEARQEKKRKKSAALAHLVKLNDQHEVVAQKNDQQYLEKYGGKVVDKSVSNQHKHKLTENTDTAQDLEPKSKKSKLKNKIIDDLEANTTNVNNLSAATFDVQQNSSQYIPENLKERQAKHIRNERSGPNIRLKSLGESSLLSVNMEDRIPIFLTDIQHLIMSTIIGNKSPFLPARWFHLEKERKLTHSVVLIVEGLSLFHYLSYESVFEKCNQIFDEKLEVVMPPYKEGRVVEELSSMPIINSHKDELIKKYGSLEAAVQATRDSSLLMKTVFPVDNVSSSLSSIEQSSNDTITRTKLLLSVLQMIEDEYPLPLNGALEKKYKDYVFTKDMYAPVTDNSPMFGLDCEMCRTVGGKSELTRISIVDELYNPVYETLVRPTNKIVDYLTKFSGITPEMMLNVTKTLEEVQQEVRQVLPPDAILVGQSLNSDFHAMRMMHPYVIDTSVIYNLSGDRRRKSKLQTLAKEFLGEEIQVHKDGHDSLEDSRASMKLTHLKLKKGIEFGDQVFLKKKKFNESESKKSEQNFQSKELKEDQQQTQNIIDESLLNETVENEKNTAIITVQENPSNLDENECKNTNVQNVEMSSSEKIHFYKVSTNKELIRKTKELCSSYDLTISNLYINPNQLELSKIQNTLTKIDKYIHKIWESVACKGLFVILFGGAPGSSNGLAMYRIKKKTAVGTDASLKSNL